MNNGFTDNINYTHDINSFSIFNTLLGLYFNYRSYNTVRQACVSKGLQTIAGLWTNVTCLAKYHLETGG